MSLPNNPELLSLFSSYLSESGLSAVSIKNYLSDLRHFLSFCNSYSASHPGSAITTNAEEVFRNLNQFLVPYTDNQKATLTPQSTTNRRLASIRRFSTFLSVKFDLPSLISDQYTSNQIVSNSDSTQTDNFFSADHTVSPDSDKSLPDTKTKTTKPQTISTAKILEQFKRSLEKEKKTHSTIKNYISDLNHFFLWTANQTPDTTQNLQNILSENQLNAYITYLKLSHTSTSVINRRGSSIKKLTRYCHEAGFISLNPFELKAPPPQLSPLAWMEWLSRKPKRLPNTPKNRLTVWYDKYTALPWTPYLNIALLILLTTGMAIFAYNQIITQARPGAAATALTPPRRQLSFQGRLTDSSGTPISTAVNVEFRLYDEQAPGGSQLYTTNACSITPDQDGIFNTFIGDGTCGTEIPIDVFTDNRDVFLEIQVGAETLTPRQQIATVGFALNSETLQGYPASAAATINTVPVVDNNGDINIAATSPSIVSSDGTFSIVGQSIAIQTAANSGGDVILQPDALGSGQILALGGTTDTDTFRITNSNLTTGSLLSGYVGNDQPFGALINLSSGASESSKFYVMTDGRTSINASATDSAFIVNQAGSGNVISASVSGSPVFTVTNSGDVDITGQYLINGSPLSLGAGGYWQRNAGALSPIAVTDPINLGSNATASALVHLAGTAGDNSFINTASFGVGTTTPDRILDVESTNPQLRLTYTDGSVYSDIYTNSAGALVLDPSSANNVITLANGGSFVVSSTTTQLNHTNGTLMFQNATINGTSGTANAVTIVPSFTPSSGTMNLNAFNLTPTINQSGTATGSYTALKVNVTETNALGTTNYLAQFGKNNTFMFNIDNNGNVGIGDTTPDAALDVVGDIYVSNGISLFENTVSDGTIEATKFCTGDGETNCVTDFSTIGQSINYWQRNNGALSPLAVTDPINLGNTATSSAYIHLAGTSGDNSFINNGFFGIGLSNPAYTLDVAGDVNITGALYDNGNAGISGQLLSSTGTGIAWIDVSSVNYWQRNDGALSPLAITDPINLGNTATSSALVHLAGTAGDNSFINNGFFGIGLNNPAYTLDVTGNINLTGALYDNGNAGTPGQILSSTGTGVEWIDNTGSGFQHWLRNDGLLYPTITTDDIAIGGTATSSALFHISGTTGAASSSSTLTFRGGADPKINILNGENFGIQTSLGGDSGLSEKVTITNSGRVGINSTNPDPTAKLEVNTSGDYSSTLTTNYTAIVGNSSVLANYTLDSSLISDYSVVGVLGVGSRPTTNGYAGYGVIGIGEGGWGESVGGLFEATSYDAVPAYGLKTKATSYTGSTAYGVYIEDTLGAGTNYGLYQAGTNDINYFAGSVGIGTLLPLATFDLRGNSGTTPTASISGNTTSAALIVDQSGTGDLFTASSSGQTRFSISNTGLVYISSLGTGVVKSTSGVLSSGAIDLSTTEVTGLLPLARGGTNNNTYTLNEILIYDGSKIASSGFTTSSFETPLTFSNGLTRTLSAVTWGGTLTQTTNIDMNGNDITFTGAGNVGIGVASPSGKFDVSGVLVVDSVNGRVGIGTSTPAVALDIAGTTSTISNSAGDITFNSASDIFNFSGDSLDNILNATISGQIKLGNFPTVGLPTSIGTGSLVFDSTTGAPKFWNGGSWQSIGSFLERTATGILYPSNSYDSLNIGGDPSSSASALIRLSSNTDFNTFFINPVAIGFSGPIDDIGGPQSTALQIAGDFLPDTTDAYYLGDSTLAWKTLYLSVGINDTTGTQLISIQNKRLTGGTPWNIVDGARIGDTSNTLPSGIKLYVANGGATISGTLGVVGDTSLIGNVTVGGGTGKIDVGTVDPPYTINGQKYGTYMAGMIGIKEEVMGKVSVTETIPGLGYRALIDLDGQTKGSDLWLFGKTTNIKENIHNLAVLLTAEGQGKTWYEIDTQNKILAVYSSTPSEVTYRLTAPRFDAANWSNNRTSESVGFVINDPDININTPGTGLLNASISAPELLAQVDNHYKLSINGAENKEISSFSESIIANLKVGAQVVFDLVAENLTIRTKLISPIADIDLLKVIDATISGTLYANDIKGRTIDTLTAQINLLDEKYATASSILADLQNKYSSYDSLLNTINIASPSSDPLNPSPLATTSATLPSDLTLDTLSVQMVLAGDILTNGSVLAQSFSSLDTDLFIQPTGDKPVHILANLMTLFPDGKVLINGDLLITGTIYANAIDTRTATVSGTLALGKGEISTDSAQLIALFDDNGQIVGSVDASGSASFGKLVTGGLVIASGSENSTATVSAQSNTNTTIGTATIATGSSEITVASSKVTDSTLIYITPISNTDNNVLYVKSKQSGLGFTVAVPVKPNQVTKEISFNYWLVETK